MIKQREKTFSKERIEVQNAVVLPEVHGLVECDTKHEDVVRWTNWSELDFQFDRIAKMEGL